MTRTAGRRLRVRVTVVTANVGRKYRGRWRVRRNIARVLRHFRGAFIGWQEIDEADPANEHGILASLSQKLQVAHRKLARASRRAWRFVGFEQLCPVSVPTADWRLVSGDVQPACPGRKRKTPPRRIVIARCQWRAPEPARDAERRLRDVVLSVMNGHLPYKTPDLWDVAFQSWKRAVIAEVAAGHLVVITMDSNHHGATPVFHSRQQVLVGANGIDLIIVVLPRSLDRAGVEVDLIRTTTVDLDVDGHNAKGAIIEISVPETIGAAA